MSDESYQRKKNYNRERNANQRIANADVGEIPPVVDAQRRRAAERSFREFLESYFPARFRLNWSADHLRVIDRIETSVLSGGLFALAMPRGSGKTTIAECAVLWALLFGHRKFGVLVGASTEAANGLIDSLKSELEANELLREDFPAVCIPIAALEGVANRCNSQHCQGVKTCIGWAKKRIVLPTVKGSTASGGVIVVRSLSGTIRGVKFTQADGSVVRPDFVILDDPQTDASARSELQCRTRSKTIATSILGLSGPGVRITAVMPCTIIRRGDLASEYLDRQTHPEWNGETCKLLLSFPSNDELWAQYMRIRDDDLRAGGNGSQATDFYRKNKNAMDAGAKVSWPDRYEPWQISGIQYAMNLYLSTNPEQVAAFFSEYQNEPQEETLQTSLLDLALFERKRNGLDMSIVPAAASLLTCHIDVQHQLLYWMVTAWGDQFTGNIIAYGTWPEQPNAYFSTRTAVKNFATEFPGLPLASQLTKALDKLVPLLAQRDWHREDDTEHRLSKILIDAADGHVTDTICQFARRSIHRQLLLPCRGVGIGPQDKPLAEYFRKEGEKHGEYWILGKMAKKTNLHLRYDTNYWKSQVAQFLMANAGQPGCLSLFGHTNTNHRLLIDHCLAERCERVASEKTGRAVDLWSLKPGKTENHHWDNLVGTAVAASLCGVQLLAPARAKSQKPATPPQRQAVTYFQM